MYLEDNMAKKAKVPEAVAEVKPPWKEDEAPKLVQKGEYCLITPKRVVIANYIHLPYDVACTIAKELAMTEHRFVTVHHEEQK
jgi:hypothetical protein